jgi:hypothetical protein
MSSNLIPLVVTYPVVPIDSGLGDAPYVAFGKVNQLIEAWNTEGGGGGGTVLSSITFALGGGTTDLGANPPGGYSGGTTNRLVINPIAGSIVTGLLAAPDGWQVRMFNASSTALLLFSNQAAGSSVNQFICPQGVSNGLEPQQGCIIEYVLGYGWVFES